jgi:DNA-binding NarL/FixJ family response regulator
MSALLTPSARMPRSVVPALTGRRAAPTLIGVAVLDDHAAVRAGLDAIIGAAPDMASVGAASGEQELHWLLERTDPSVLVVDVHHPGLHGLALSLRLKHRSSRPGIVLYSGRGGDLLSVAAAVAGVDVVVSKSDTERALLEAIRQAARPGDAVPDVTLQAQGRSAGRIDPADHGILAMRLAGHSWADIAATLRVSVASVVDRGADASSRRAWPWSAPFRARSTRPPRPSCSATCISRRSSWCSRGVDLALPART